jgi:uncharacterized membrane protein
MSRQSSLSIAVSTLLALALLASAHWPAAAGTCEGPAYPRAAYYLLSIVPANATKWVDASTPQKSATYGFQVKNTGDSDLAFCDLVLSPWPFGDKWSYNFIPSAPFEVSPSETKTILLVIYPAPDAEAKRYTFSLKGRNNSTGNSIQINLDVRQYANVLVKAPPAQTADPGETLEFGFEIRNTGNGKDRFFVVSVEAGLKSIQPYLKDGNNWTLDLAAGKSVIKTVVAPLPFDARTTEGTSGIQLSMTVRSNINASQQDIAWTFIQINHLYDIVLDVSPPSARVLPGEMAAFTITVLNLGNGNDNVSLDMTAKFNGSGWNIDLQRASLCLRAGSSNSTGLKITPPLDALAGSKFDFDIVACSAGPPNPETPIERSETVSITILKTPVPIVVHPTVFVHPRSIFPGEPVLFTFNISNRGNAEELVNLTIVEIPSGWHVTPDLSGNIRIPPYCTQEAGLSVQSSVDRNESLMQSYYVKAQVVNAAGTATVNLTFEVPVGPLYEWELAVEGPAMAKVNPSAGALQGFALSLKNTGNAPDEVQLSLEGECASWGRLDASLLPLACGEHRSVRLAVRVPAGAEPGRGYVLRILASSLNQPALVKETGVTVVVIRLDVSVVPPGRLEINGIVLNGCNATQGARLDLAVTARNDGTELVGPVNVRFFDNGVLFAERNTSAIGPMKTARVAVVWSARTLGVHVLTAKLDADGRLAEADEGNNEGAATVVVNEVLPREKPPPPAGWVQPALVIVLVFLAAAAAYVGYARRPGRDRELYESVYRREGGGDTRLQLVAERAEVERRARGKGGGGFGPSLP